MVLRIFKMIANQWLSDSFRVHQIRYRSGLLPDPLEELTSLPRPSAGLSGHTSKEERKGRERERERRRGGGRNGRDPLFANSWIRPYVNDSHCVIETAM